MEYAGQASAMKVGGQPDTRPLESLASAVQRINSATVTVQGFIDRFHGEEPANAGEEPASLSQPPYTVTIDKLFSALNRLENRVEALTRIG